MSTKRKAPGKLAAPVVRPSPRVPNKNTIDEARASIAGADVAFNSSNVETIDISSDPDSDEDLSDAPAGDDDEQDAARQQAQPNGDKNTDTASRLKARRGRLNGKDAASPANADDANADSDADADATSPSFGELLRAENEVIDVPSLLHPSTASLAATQPARNAIAPHSHQSLATVLTQALRTDDTDLLESCLHTTDLSTVRNTIERLDSSLAGVLLTKLAARLYRRPGRAGNLMTWVQWTLVAHGGALASQPKVIHSLNGLQKVLAERAKGLNSLLALKGKLDMLEGQMELRRRMSRAGVHSAGDEDDEDVIWVEGEDRAPVRRKGLDDDDEDGDDDVPITNGFVGDSDDEDEESGPEIDDSEGADEDLDEDDVDHDDVDESMGEDDESDVDAAPTAKVQKTGGAFSKRR